MSEKESTILTVASVFATILNIAIILFFQLTFEEIIVIFSKASAEVTAFASLLTAVTSLIIVLTNKSYNNPERGYLYFMIQPTVEENIFRTPFVLGFFGIVKKMQLVGLEYWGLFFVVLFVQALVFAPGHNNPMKKFLLALVWFPMFCFVGIAPAILGHTTHNIAIKFLGGENY